MLMQNIIMIMGKSGAWKTTLLTHLNTHFKLGHVCNYTTRVEREWEETEYNHISVSDFLEKIIKQEIIEYVNFGGIWYWIEKPTTDCCLIMIPEWYAQMVRWCIKNNVGYKLIYLDMDNKIRIKRLIARWDSLQSVISREADDKYLDIFKTLANKIYSNDWELDDLLEKIYADFNDVFDWQMK